MATTGEDMRARFLFILEMCDAGIEMKLHQLRKRHPDAPDAEIQRRFRELVEARYGPVEQREAG